MSEVNSEQDDLRAKLIELEQRLCEKRMSTYKDMEEHNGTPLGDRLWSVLGVYDSIIPHINLILQQTSKPNP